MDRYYTADDVDMMPGIPYVGAPTKKDAKRPAPGPHACASMLRVKTATEALRKLRGEEIAAVRTALEGERAKSAVGH